MKLPSFCCGTPIPDTGVEPPAENPKTQTIVSLPHVQSTPTALADILAPTASAPTSVPRPTTAAPPSLRPAPTLPVNAPALSTGDGTSNAISQASPPRPPPAHLSAAIISLIAVGAVCLLFAVCIVLRVYTRPRKRVHPTPSLPILQEDSPTAEKGGDESPLFGGEERFSRASANARWTWTQYRAAPPKDTTTTFAPSATTAHHIPEPAFIPYELPYADQEATIQVAKTAVFAQPAVTQTVAPHDGRTKYKSRLSTATLFEQASAGTAADYATNPDAIGVAVSSEELARIAYADAAASTTTLGRSTSERARRASMRPYDARRSTFHAGTGSPRDGLAYAASPPLASGHNFNDRDGDGNLNSYYAPGRARIKSPYGAGSYLRTSVSTSAASARGYSVNPFDDAAIVVPPLPPMPQGGRTDALAAALGLVGPAAAANAATISSPSMRTTLYPDDSLSVAGDRRRVPAASKRSRAPAAEAGVGSPGSEAASVALGQLMMSTLSPKVGDTLEDGAHGAASVRRRADDRPPRVPSPPPLPSLAQMAMANDQAYGDYRSPTYSIYGLYDPDRKSRMEG